MADTRFCALAKSILQQMFPLHCVRLRARDLQSASVLARLPWGIWLRLIGRDAEPLTFMHGDGVEPEAVGQLKERFARSENWAELAEALGCLIREYGRGALRRFPAFRLVDRGTKPSLEPIRHFAEFPLGWLEGNEARIQVLEENTRYLLAGYRAHNALIWGPRGGGKSTLIRALVGKFFDRGLRAIEISPSCYHLLPDLFTLVRGRRQRFVGVLDNVSLGRGDDSLHLLSRTLDGGLEACPENLVFYATSNYKDLVDREGERPQGLGQMQLDDERPNRVNQGIQAKFYDPQQLQRLDQERALDDRFALKVFLDLPSRQQYRSMVLSYARRAGIDLSEEDLLAALEIWRMRHNHDLVGGPDGAGLRGRLLAAVLARQGRVKSIFKQLDLVTVGIVDKGHLAAGGEGRAPIARPYFDPVVFQRVAKAD